MAHDLIHIAITRLYGADFSKSVSPYVAFRDLLSVCIGRKEVGMAPRCEAPFPVNGTAVPDGITSVPFSAGL
jgi:hypothetical protein